MELAAVAADVVNIIGLAALAADVVNIIGLAALAADVVNIMALAAVAADVNVMGLAAVAADIVNVIGLAAMAADPLSRESKARIPSLIFRHLPPNSDRIGNTTEGRGTLYLRASVSPTLSASSQKVWL